MLSRRVRALLQICLGALAALPLVLTVSAVTGAPRGGNGFTDNASQPPLTFGILDPGDCSGCHGNFDSVNNIEPFPTWSGSMMANAGRDPIFWAALDVANRDLPGIGTYCLRCHAPAGWLAGRAGTNGGTPDGCSLIGALDETDNDFEGVSCHLCHRMMVNPSPPGGQQNVYLDNAQYWIDDGDCSTPGSGPCRRGPYDYPLGGPDVAPPHEWAFSEYHTESQMCANCHNVTNPVKTLINQAGVNTGIPYPIERTYKEWQQSSFSQVGVGQQTCQKCHMPDATQKEAYACVFQDNNRSGNMGVHQFVGGNTWIPALLRDTYPTLGRTAAYNATIAWATDLLQNQSAQVAVTGPTDVEPGDTMPVSVRVTNLAGHKLPTGYVEGRRMWLQVEARDAVGRVFFTSGAYNAATGVLTEDPQIKIYQTERGVWNRNGQSTCDIVDGGGRHVFNFVLNDCIKLDNRIPPLGFSGASDLETQPVGYTYPETSPGSGVLVNYDDTTYQIPVPGGLVAPVTVEARLLYQTSSKEYIEFLRDEAVNGGFPDDCIPRSFGNINMSRGEYLYQLWTQTGRSAPTVMKVAADAVVLNNGVFANGFESGNTSGWSSVGP
jgi:hypothetical protein